MYEHVKQIMGEKYGFRDTAVVTDAVYDIMSAAQGDVHVYEGDYSGFDVLRCKLTHTIWERLCHAIFGDEIGKQAFTTMKSNWAKSSWITFGKDLAVKVDMGMELPTGVIETSLINTVENFCLTYLGYRHAGLTHGEAWARLGIFCGDDSLVACTATERQAFLKLLAFYGYTFKDLKIENAASFVSRFFFKHTRGSAPNTPRMLVKAFVVPASLPEEERLSYIATRARQAGRGGPFHNKFYGLLARLSDRDCEAVETAYNENWPDMPDGVSSADELEVFRRFGEDGEHYVNLVNAFDYDEALADSQPELVLKSCLDACENAYVVSPDFDATPIKSVKRLSIAGAHPN
jgi:hypothetical protein